MPEDGIVEGFESCVTCVPGSAEGFVDTSAAGTGLSFPKIWPSL
jgi:hypothetical protein